MYDFNLVMSCIPGDHAQVKRVCSYHFVFWKERSILNFCKISAKYWPTFNKQFNIA